MSNRLVAALALAAVSLAVPAFAQAPAAAPSSYTFVAQWQIPRANWGQFTGDFEKNTRPVLEKLAADGTLTSWGAFETIVHTADGATHGVWWSAGSYAAMEKARGQLLAASSASGSLASATAHSDLYLSTIVGATKPSSGTGYLSVSIQLMKPGKGREFRELWEKNSKPVFDELLAKGTLVAYVLHGQDVHSDNPGLRWSVTLVPTAEADDQLGAAFDAASAKLTPQERQTRELVMDNIIERSAHRDLYAKVIRYWQK